MHLILVQSTKSKVECRKKNPMEESKVKWSYRIVNMNQKEHNQRIRINQRISFSFLFAHYSNILKYVYVCLCVFQTMLQ